MEPTNPPVRTGRTIVKLTLEEGQSAWDNLSKHTKVLEQKKRTKKECDAERNARRWCTLKRRN